MPIFRLVAFLLVIAAGVTGRAVKAARRRVHNSVCLT